MHLAVYLPLMIPVLAALAARPLADRLAPAAASSAVLGLLALTALVRVPPVAAIANLSVQAISRSDTVSLPVAVAAGALLAAAAAAACRALWRRGTAIVAAGRQARRLPGAGQVVVTENDAADAYTLPGWPCRIVITSGMLRAAANPLLRPVAAQVGYTVERWADEDAAAAAGDRPLTARAIARAAMASTAAPPDRAGQATALGLVGDEDAEREQKASLRRAGPVPRRVAALLGPPPRTSLLLLGGAVLLVALSGASALEAARNLHQLLELAQSARS